MTKRFLSLFFTLAIILSQATGGVNAVYAAESEIRVLVDGKQLAFDQPPVMVNNRVIVPMRAILESLGFIVTWDEHNNTALGSIMRNNAKINISVNIKNRTMWVRYQEFQIDDTNMITPTKDSDFMLPLGEDAPVRIINGRTLLPTRAIAEGLGYKVDWDGKTNTVTITSSNSIPQPPDGWIDRLETHMKVYCPEQLGVIKIYREKDDAKREYDLQSTPTPTEELISPSQNPKGTKVYSVYDMKWGKEFLYTFKNPPIPTSPPVVGSAPAKILIDPNKSKKLFIDNPDNPYEPIRNVTDSYYGGFSYGGCEWYAGGRFWEVYGIPLPHFNKFFVAHEFLEEAEEYDEFLVIRDVNDIRANAIVVKGASPTNPSGGGHVAFIEYVERDAEGKPIKIYYTETNGGDSNNGDYDYGIDGRINVKAFNEFLTTGKPVIGYIIPNESFYK